MKWLRKPPRPQINRHHWFGRHVKHAFIPNHSNREYDPASRKKWTLNSTAEIQADIVDLPLNTATVEQSIPWSTWTEATVFFRFKVTTGANADRFFSVFHSGADDIRFYINSSYDFLIAWDDGTPTAQTFADGNNTDEFILIASHDGSTQRAWLYNTNTGTLSVDSVSDSFTFSGLDGTTQIGGASFTTADVDDCYFRYCYIANKAVKSTSQARDLINNEYSLLKPREIYLPAAAGASTKTVSDSGAGSDAISALAVSLAVTDLGAGVDASPGLANDFSVLDVGVGADGLGLNVSLSISDTASGLDAVSVIMSAFKTVVDSGLGVDGLTISANVPIADSGSGIDAIQIAALVSLLETATGADVVSRFDAGVKIATLILTFSARRMALVLSKRDVVMSLATRSVEFSLVN